MNSAGERQFSSQFLIFFEAPRSEGEVGPTIRRFLSRKMESFVGRKQAAVCRRGVCDPAKETSPTEARRRIAATCRTCTLVQMGELSSGRHALDGASLAPGTRQILEALRDPNRRPPLPRDPLPQVIREHQPSVSFALDAQRFAVKYIKNHFHLTTTFIKQPLSSNNHFHQTTTFIKQPLSSNNQFHQTTTFIKNHLHQKPISSKNQFHQKTNFIKNQFHQKPISSETNFIRKK